MMKNKIICQDMRQQKHLQTILNKKLYLYMKPIYILTASN